MSSDTLTGTWPSDIKIARGLMQKDGEEGDYLTLDEETDARLLHDGHPGHWAVSVDGDVVDVIDAHAYANARALADHLATYTNGQLHNPETTGRGFQ